MVVLAPLVQEKDAMTTFNGEPPTWSQPIPTRGDDMPLVAGWYEYLKCIELGDPALAK
jgi:hypothetical protein